jgi:hypothetical protein
MPIYFPPPLEPAPVIVLAKWHHHHHPGGQWTERYIKSRQAREAREQQERELREAATEKQDARDLPANELAEMRTLARWTQERVAELTVGPAPTALKPTAITVSYGSLVPMPYEPSAVQISPAPPLMIGLDLPDLTAEGDARK